MADGVIAREGEIVTCQNGHDIARVKTDLFRGDRLPSSALASLRPDLEFVPGTRIDPCPDCGGRYVRMNGGGMQIHIGNEWRP